MVNSPRLSSSRTSRKNGPLGIVCVGAASSPFSSVASLSPPSVFVSSTVALDRSNKSSRLSAREASPGVWFSLFHDAIDAVLLFEFDRLRRRGRLRQGKVLL